LKRSNRLILLIGLFLAVVAFVGVILLTNNGSSGTGTPAAPTTTAIVVAAQDIPLAIVALIFLGGQVSKVLSTVGSSI